MKDFQQALLEAIETANKSFGVRQMRLLKNIEAYGAVAALKEIFRKNQVSDGFEQLCRIGHTELTAEALAVKYHTLFTDDEINFCFSELCAVGFYKA
ncbi:MAG: hypothetical protein E7434_07040 [Ruminococcaceae bacterium]|nr:hypothetical protein [Oscillospiraceae bacterium]